MTKKESGTEEITPWELTGLPIAPAGGSPASGDLEKIIRKNYREPIAEDDTVCAEIDGRTHRVCDIGSRGMGLIVPALSGFLAGTLYGIMLHIDNNTITLRGKVTHISPSETSGECQCGIEFIELNPKDEEALQQFLTAHHARLFSTTSRSADLGRD
ncbi:PilZ domain-containing protein [Thiovibrio frasassiensis]|uniref:PilZ domain-containing protein n=1 Tax=Thiovibrio frasassiensis TaxID=2984131 RepID=A0A9X4MF86_9BACT|nr:PilZ domain-containing protein [Thiovibrio frasassiensis]MDG4475256.1 PilZ domain-containing protein [Thiovibrio frasassiensis]